MARISSSSFRLIARASRFWVFWIRKTIRKVTIVVPVFITSCQVSEKWKIGPVTAHVTIRSPAHTKAIFDPIQDEAQAAKRPNRSVVGFSDLISLIFLAIGASHSCLDAVQAT